MKTTMKTAFLCAAAASAVLFVSATVWEGVTDVAVDRDLPMVYSVATNSFPRNTVVDITNLENGKMVRVIVVFNLDTTGLLARLSRNAADAIDLRHDSTCRIRMIQTPVNVSQQDRAGNLPLVLQLGSIDDMRTLVVDSEAVEGTDSVVMSFRFAIPENAPAAENVPATDGSPAVNILTVEEPDTDTWMTEDDVIAIYEPSVEDTVITSDIITMYEPSGTDTVDIVDESVDESSVPNIIIAESVPAGAVPVEAEVKTQPEPRAPFGMLTLVPADERIPTAEDQSVFAYGETTSGNTASRDAALKNAPGLIDQIAETPAAYAPPVEFSPFQAPLINSLEQGKWYVQLGVYSRPDNVEDEISRIGTSYPVAIQNIGTDTSPIFRVLLGPLNQGESGAMLQRFKSIGYADAFVRHN